MSNRVKIPITVVPPPDMGDRVAVVRDRGLTATAKNQPSVSTRFYLINSNRGHAVGVMQIRGRQTDITKLKNVSMMQPKRFIFLEFLIYSELTSKLTLLGPWGEEEGGSEARMTKLKAANQKPLTL